MHLRDMVSLQSVHPDVFLQFEAGNFMMKKTDRPFSAMAIDQAHEQNNATVKGDGGAVGLTENPIALKRWMLCGPEMARVTAEFESSFGREHGSDSEKHHDQAFTVQSAFVKDTKYLTKVLDDMGNPFSEEGEDLLILDTRDIVEKDTAEAVLGLGILG